MDYRRRDIQKLLLESPRRRRIDEIMRVSFLSSLPEEEWERYQSELERKNKSDLEPSDLHGKEMGRDT